MTTNLGRLDPVVTYPKADAPEQQMAAVMSKLDEIIAKLNLMGAAIEAATDGNSLFTQLDKTAIKSAIDVITLSL